MFKCGEIAKAVKGTITGGSPDCEVLGVSTDTRKIKRGDLFIPLVGERFDGHDYIESALSAGAAAVLSQRDTGGKLNGTVIVVRDTRKALGDLAAWHRSRFPVPFVAITGSVGKTSTKDMIAGVLGKAYNVLKTEGNFNNEIGLPLTLLKLDSTHEAAVIEMGMSGFGEISTLTALTRPDIAVITNIGMSHIEKLGSRQNILKAKMEILEGLNKNGLVVLNGDDKLLAGLKGLLKFRTVFYGMEEGVDYRAENVKTYGENGTGFEIRVGGKDYEVKIPAPGIHNIHNALAAIAVGMELKVPVEGIIAGIEEFTPGKMRMNIISTDGFRIINDTYNASPQSMEAAISVLKDISAEGRSIAVLGDMLEMGEWAPRAHEDVGRYTAAMGISLLVTVGTNGRHIAEGALKAGKPAAGIVSFNTNQEASSFLDGIVGEGDTVLVKGSRGMKMEEIVNKLRGESV